ncbi:MAG: DUF177 domain-containing protein [Nitrospirota bacterium]
MKILISEIPEEGLALELHESLESDLIVSPINARLKIDKVGTEVIVKGSLTAEVKLQCSRCLKDFIMVVSVPVDVVYRPVEELRGEEIREIKGDELDMDFYSGDELDILDLLKEQIILNLPMKPLCSEFCKGICIKCGADLNQDSCSCVADEIDPRFEALKRFLK